MPTDTADPAPTAATTNTNDARDDACPLAAAGSTRPVRLKVAFLVPLGLAVVVLIGLFTHQTNSHVTAHIEDEARTTLRLTAGLYATGIDQAVDKLGTAIQAISRDEVLRDGLEAGDRAALLARAAPLFHELRSRHQITHFYFLLPDRECLLRVHQPDRFGDRIDRFTALEAERTGGIAHGLELGPLGTFTLRLVMPWYDPAEQNRRLGYVEVGMEIESLLDEIRQLTGAQLLVAIDKALLNRTDWETGMRMLGRTPEWTAFPDAILSLDTTAGLAPTIAEALAARGQGLLSPDDVTLGDGLVLDHGGRHLRALFLPLLDAPGRTVGEMIPVLDVTEDKNLADRLVYGSGGGALLIGLGLMAFFHRRVGRIETELEDNRRSLAHLAARDALTGLLNRRAFMPLLDQEIARCRRYGRSFVLLMIDLDHFKQVNDRHGHPAGDHVLARAADRLAREARGTDRLARYGGEEFILLLVETEGPEGLDIAERVRAAINERPFVLDQAVQLDLTASIGLAHFPGDATTADEVIAAADQALYQAKTGGRDRVVAFRPAAEPGGDGAPPPAAG
ncbi:sensor domain-containing diguanylate cyclase [Roseospirillum parvum]|uniref:diguanylate cyclase n=1 Tax=Roseospirillum parvum TaxID=83401 RepID=A0A1G7ZPH8_9PROT|nr:diguanylate cyclase [Roseospirillum parvum]SDH10559.1 diguanylate cyclase (GGDEF) domain-containing protein [Roseospirillum parvum]